jgi:hypothetical protein
MRRKSGITVVPQYTLVIRTILDKSDLQNSQMPPKNKDRENGETKDEEEERSTERELNLEKEYLIVFALLGNLMRPICICNFVFQSRLQLLTVETDNTKKRIKTL